MFSDQWKILVQPGSATQPFFEMLKFSEESTSYGDGEEDSSSQINFMESDDNNLATDDEQDQEEESQEKLNESSDSGNEVQPSGGKVS